MCFHWPRVRCFDELLFCDKGILLTKEERNSNVGDVIAILS
jgi:hypothetical protein